jgi:SH3-like domain-containing protein
VRSRIVVEDLTAITAPFTREDTFEVDLDKDPRHRVEAHA